MEFEDLDGMISSSSNDDRSEVCACIAFLNIGCECYRKRFVPSPISGDQNPRLAPLPPIDADRHTQGLDLFDPLFQWQHPFGDYEGRSYTWPTASRATTTHSHQQLERRSHDLPALDFSQFGSQRLHDPNGPNVKLLGRSANHIDFDISKQMNRQAKCQNQEIRGRSKTRRSPSEVISDSCVNKRLLLRRKETVSGAIFGKQGRRVAGIDRKGILSTFQELRAQLATPMWLRRMNKIDENCFLEQLERLAPHVLNREGYRTLRKTLAPGKSASEPSALSLAEGFCVIENFNIFKPILRGVGELNIRDPRLKKGEESQKRYIDGIGIQIRSYLEVPKAPTMSDLIQRWLVGTRETSEAWRVGRICQESASLYKKPDLHAPRHPSSLRFVTRA